MTQKSDDFRQLESLKSYNKATISDGISIKVENDALNINEGKYGSAVRICSPGIAAEAVLFCDEDLSTICQDKASITGRAFKYGNIKNCDVTDGRDPDGECGSTLIGTCVFEIYGDIKESPFITKLFPKPCFDVLDKSLQINY